MKIFLKKSLSKNMIKVYDFKCESNHTTEHFVQEETTCITCPECGLNASRIISGGNFSLDAMSGDFPKASKKWAVHHEKAASAGNQ